MKSESTIELSAILPCFNSNNEHYLPSILIFACKRASMASFARSLQYSTLSSTSIYKYTLQRLPSPVGSVCIRVDSLIWCWVSIECRWWLLGNYSVSSFFLLRAGDCFYRQIMNIQGAIAFWAKSTCQVTAVLPILAGNSCPVTPYVASPVLCSWRIRCLYFWALSPQNPLSRARKKSVESRWTDKSARWASWAI